MGDLSLIFDFLVETMATYLTMMNSLWYTQCILFLVLTGIVINVLVTLRR